jgi:hypothetical protein
MVAVHCKRSSLREEGSPEVSNFELRILGMSEMAMVDDDMVRWHA